MLLDDDVVGPEPGRRPLAFSLRADLVAWRPLKGLLGLTLVRCWVGMLDDAEGGGPGEGDLRSRSFRSCINETTVSSGARHASPTQQLWSVRTDDYEGLSAGQLWRLLVVRPFSNSAQPSSDPFVECGSDATDETSPQIDCPQDAQVWLKVVHARSRQKRRARELG